MNGYRNDDLWGHQQRSFLFSSSARYFSRVVQDIRRGELRIFKATESIQHMVVKTSHPKS